LWRLLGESAFWFRIVILECFAFVGFPSHLACRFEFAMAGFEDVDAVKR